MPFPFRPCFQLILACKSRGHESLGKMKGERSHAHDSTSNTIKYKKCKAMEHKKTKGKKAHKARGKAMRFTKIENLLLNNKRILVTTIVWLLTIC